MFFSYYCFLTNFPSHKLLDATTDRQSMLSSPPYTPHPTTPFPGTPSVMEIVGYTSLTKEELQDATLIMCHEDKHNGSQTEMNEEGDDPLMDAELNGIVVLLFHAE